MICYQSSLKMCSKRSKVPIFFRLRRGPLAAAQAAGARESRHGSADPLPSFAARHYYEIGIVLSDKQEYSQLKK